MHIVWSGRALQHLDHLHTVLQAGVPPEVYTTCVGGPDTGSALLEHPAVASVFFTGSYDTGRQVGCGDWCGQLLVSEIFHVGSTHAR